MNNYKLIEGGVTAPKGFLAAGISAGIKKTEVLDMAMIVSECMANSAGCFTTNAYKAAPVLVSMKHMEDGLARAIVVNSGNANACTGKDGMQDAEKMAVLVANELKISPWDVIVASTGVIGVPLPMEKVEKGIVELSKKLKVDGSDEAANAIMTTDTFTKKIAVSVMIDNKEVIIGGIAKGSGMIHPNMATMLSFITTDAAIDSDILKEALKHSCEHSYNMITVDGDTSTNDMVLCLANGMAGNVKIKDHCEDYLKFYEALNYVNTELAKMIAKDGEGATKLLSIRVVNAKSEQDAKKAAKAVGGSSLVKSAFFGEDANWGRIFAALGYSGARLGELKTDVSFVSENGQIKIAKDGCGLPFDEKYAREVLKASEIEVIIDLKDGEYSATAWGCDLTYDYVKINISYRS